MAKKFLTWTTLAVVIILPSIVRTNRHGSCTLQTLKDAAKNACDDLSNKLRNDTRDPFHRGRENLGFHLPLGNRDRRHTSTQRHHLHHEYHKLNTRLTHGSRGGYMELSYSTSLYEMVQQRVGPGNSVSEWTSNFLSSKGFDAAAAAAAGAPLPSTRYDVGSMNRADEQYLEIIPLRHRRSADESLEGLRNRRANHAKISYCCEHTDSAKCSDWLCYI